MSSGLSVALPLTLSPVFGPYALNTTFYELAKQNLKMLLLTAPGEKIMNPSFGVGLKTYLFEMNGESTYSAIREKIGEQVKIYLPYIRITGLDFKIPENNPDFYPHNLSMTVSFTIVPLQIVASLELTVGVV